MYFCCWESENLGKSPLNAEGFFPSSAPERKIGLWKRKVNHPKVVGSLKFCGNLEDYAFSFC
jgi:hypothetical protein